MMDISGCEEGRLIRRQQKKRELLHLVIWGIPYANTYGIPRNSAEFREKFTIKIPRNSAKFGGIPCVFQKIPYSAGSEKSTSVDTLLIGLSYRPARLQRLLESIPRNDPDPQH